MRRTYYYVTGDRIHHGMAAEKQKKIEKALSLVDITVNHCETETWVRYAAIKRLWKYDETYFKGFVVEFF